MRVLAIVRNQGGALHCSVPVAMTTVKVTTVATVAVTVTVTVTNALIPHVSMAGTTLRDNGLVDGNELQALVRGVTVNAHAPTNCCHVLLLSMAAHYSCVCAQVEEVCAKAGINEVRAAGLVVVLPRSGLGLGLVLGI